MSIAIAFSGLLCAAPVSASLLISELYIHPAGDSTLEWIEILNTSDAVIDLSGYILDDIEGGGSPEYTITNILIQPYQYLVIEQQLSGLRLNDSGDTVRLLDPTGSLIDSVTYTAASGAAIDKGYARISLEAHEFMLLEPTRGSGSLMTPVPTSTPGITLSPTPIPITTIQTPLLRITEVYACSGTDQNEWVELYNYGSASTDLTGFRIRDLSDNEKPLTETINAAAYQVISWPSGFLNNTGDRVQIISASGAIIDTMEYALCKPDISLAFESETWKQTTALTPGSDNRIVSPVASATPVPPTATPPPSVPPTGKPSPSATPTHAPPALMPTHKTSRVLAAATESSVIRSGLRYSESETGADAVMHESEPRKRASSALWFFASGIAILSAGYVLLHQHKP